jgi:hypothetical protein
MQAIGKCKLCLEDGVPLEDSHYLSAGIYRRLRDDGQKNPHPWLLTNTTAVQTSSQMTAPLLCRPCEQRFSRNGENWTLRHCLQKDRNFPLAAILASRSPDICSPPNPTKLYFASNIPEINSSALTYFAASIFWRGSIHPWSADGSIPVELGPFRERFRRYLLEQEPFPTHACLWLIVREGKEIDRITYAPLGARQDKLHVYKFPMPGFAFMLTVSKNIPQGHRNKCFVHGLGNPIIVTSLIEGLLLDEATKMRQRSLLKLRAS